MTLFWMSGPNQISNQPGSRVDSQHKRLHHIRSERPGTGHQLAERPAERDIAYSLPSSNNTWSSTSSSLKKAAQGQNWLPRARRWFPGKPGSTVVHRQWARLPAPVLQSSGSCDPTAACGSRCTLFCTTVPVYATPPPCSTLLTSNQLGF